MVTPIYFQYMKRLCNARSGNQSVNAYMLIPDQSSHDPLLSFTKLLTSRGFLGLIPLLGKVTERFKREEWHLQLRRLAEQGYRRKPKSGKAKKIIIIQKQTKKQSRNKPDWVTTTLSSELPDNDLFADDRFSGKLLIKQRQLNKSAQLQHDGKPSN